ncbi:hypothetical protein CU633_09950 [Bacillus sp. V3-13]|uniref:hypothetical protein n=1 Tax=Bacillus sp. V3-13 TaxID=2053728 RepID=UPI000C75AE36|nr:hypothetical protein [Bacillus sp. V3-13]PLR77513.1 hypothetical protein CU633_09950 [Bacillus sp. V3-13]
MAANSIKITRNNKLKNGGTPTKYRTIPKFTQPVAGDNVGISLRPSKLLGKNPQSHKTRINTDIDGGRAVAKSIFRHYTKNKKVIQTEKNGMVRRSTTDNSISIRMYKKGKTNIDNKLFGQYEDIHFRD